MTRKTTISLRLQAYAYPYETASFDVPAYVEGDLAVHRPMFWGSSKDAPTEHKGWTIAHVPSGLGVGRALPARFKYPRDCKRNDLLAFAKAWQAECPAFFDAARGEDRAHAMSFGAAAAIEAAKGL